MQPQVVTKTIQLSDGRSITIETGKLARQADGAVVVRMGDTMLLATVVSAAEAREDAGFFPLSVDYQEKFASAGKIPGGFLKREGRLSEHEILTSRLVDRAIRPMFPDEYMADTQVNIMLISADAQVMPDALAALAASSAIAVSDIPFPESISEVRVVRSGGEYIVNPNEEQTNAADINLIIAGSLDNIIMVEGEAKEMSESDMLEAIQAAHEVIKLQCKAQQELAEEVGVVKREFTPPERNEELYQQLYDQYYDKMYAVASQGIDNKDERKNQFKVFKNEYIDSLPEDHEIELAQVHKYFSSIQKKASRDLVLNDRKRLDGRQLDEVRSIYTEVNYLPTAHGSAVFTRGETQSLTTVTLGTKLDEQMIDRAMVKGTNKFLLHYNFPAFSTGEIRPNRGPGRREIGHGNLAHRALKECIPADEDNPYTIRVVSDILESNGSSSMATVCAGSMALMDAGIPIKRPVSGIAMGLISDPETKKYAILSDILGDEDHLGDMDFKVTGTENGITACQMDIKVDGLPYEVLKEALSQANAGRMHILQEMAKTISKSNDDLKPNAPRSETVKIASDMIGALIGPGGKVVQEIQKETDTTIVIEEKDNQGIVNVFATDQEAMDKALGRIKAIVAMPTVGEVYDGIVKSIMPFGAFVEFMPGKDGLLHISEIRWERVEKMDGVMEVGEELKVKLTEIDRKTGKYRLSRKALLPKPDRANRD
ncbi:MAG: polyribonucleotide nucleotidyltransferase [Tunicatimonas sp.]|uniref:polyribonucleotide nucleotidyltransferase n=1 Tax=Tunicatimonas sp. TaxID=1940096 RepID=UPI003C741EB9